MSYRYPFSGTQWRNVLDQNNAIFPNDTVTELALEGFAPIASLGGNDGHPSDLYDSLEQEIPGKNAEALYFSIYAAELASNAVNIEGHDHQAPEVEIEWLPLWQSNFCTGLAASLNIGNAAGAYWDSQTYKELGYAIIPFGQYNTDRQSFMYFRARGAAPAYGSATTPDLDIKITIYRSPSAASIEITTAMPDSPFVLKIPYNTIGDWVTGPVYDLGANIYAAPDNEGWKFFYAKLEIRASSSPGAVVLYEVQVGRIGGK